MKKPAKFNLKKASLLPEPLKSAGPEREACKLCKRWQGPVPCQKPDVPEEWTGKLVVVMAGNEGVEERKLTRRMWRKAGWGDEDVALVSAVRCGKSEPSMTQVRACRPFLLKALQVLSPKHIVAVGSTALRALRNDGEKNIIKNRGRDHDIPCDIPSEASAGGGVLP